MLYGVGALLLLRKPNRRFQPWAMFALLVVGRLFLAGPSAMMPSFEAVILVVPFVIEGYVLSLAILLLVSDWVLRGSAPFKAILVAATLAGLCLFSGLVVYSGYLFYEQLAAYFILIVTGSLALIAGWALARRLARSKGPRSFFRWLPVAMIMVSLSGAFVFLLWILLIGEPMGLIQAVSFLLLGGVIVGGCFYLLSVPFIAFALRSDMYRERLAGLIPAVPEPEKLSPPEETM